MIYLVAPNVSCANIMRWRFHERFSQNIIQPLLPDSNIAGMSFDGCIMVFWAEPGYGDPVWDRMFHHITALCPKAAILHLLKSR